MKQKISKAFAYFVGGIMVAIGLAAVAGQSPQGINPALNPSGYYSPLRIDSNNSLSANTDGDSVRENITASAVVKATPGMIARVIVVSAPVAAGAMYDASSISAASSVNKVFTIPATAGVYEVKVPASNGIVIDPNNGQMVVTYK